MLRLLFLFLSTYERHIVKYPLLVALALAMLMPSVSEAKQPTNMKGYIKVAQKAYPGKCNGKIKVRWDVRRSKLRTCDISLEKDYWKDADRKYRCLAVSMAVGQLHGVRVPAPPKACSSSRRS